MTTPRDETQARRIEELLVQRATEGLSAAEALELAALGAEDDRSFDATIAKLYVAMPQDELPLPPRLFDRIATSTEEAADAATVAFRKRLCRRRSEWVAWSTAAIGLGAAAAIVLWATNRSPVEVEQAAVPPVATIHAQRLHLLTLPDTQAMAWNPTKDPAGLEVRGDVVWNPSQQKGFVKFEGLGVNDPKRSQYQLWIFDKDRDRRFPVDGGVFDIGVSGEAIVRITPRLRISKAVLFAVSIEPPGGEVVSKRERIVATATPSG